MTYLLSGQDVLLGVRHQEVHRRLLLPCPDRTPRHLHRYGVGDGLEHAKKKGPGGRLFGKCVTTRVK